MDDRSRVPSEDRQFGDMVVAQGLCGREKVDECLSFLARLIADGVTPVPRLGELLARKGYLSADRVDATFRPSGAGRDTRVDLELPKEASAAARDPANLLGKYVKVAPLGAGGMGEVWRGWDRELRRWVALKFLHHADAAQQARFLREAQTAAALNHPNIASVYEVGEKDGKPFIAMQYIAGQTLATVPRNDLKNVVSLVRDAALAVQSAHEQGVIHRDLKPANLMVESSRVYVMDFGLAKPTAVDSSLSASGQILGTPAYMAPEQARGDSALVGARSDVYSLGATLYELLTGRTPHHATEVYALLKKIIEEDPVPLRRRNPRVPRDLETIVLKCLEKEPDRRYASARELADDLGRWLSGEVILAHPPSVAYRLRKFFLRRQAAVITGILVGVLAVGILLPNWIQERARRKSLAELAELRTRMLMLKEWTRQSFRKPEDIRAAIGKEIKKVSDFIARYPDVPQGYYVRAQGRILGGQGIRAERDLREALRLDATFVPAWSLLARVKLEDYLDKKEQGENPQEREASKQAARPVLEEAMKALRKAWTESSDAAAIERWGLSRTPDDTVVEKLTTFIWTWFVEMKPEKALADLRRANEETPSEEFCVWLGICSGTLEEHLAWIDRAILIAPHYAFPWRDRAHTNLERKDVDGAIRDYSAVIVLEPDLPESHVNLAAALIQKGDLDRALACCSHALDLDPEDGAAWVTRAAIQQRRGNFDASERDATEGIRLIPGQPLGYSNRAAALLGKRDWKGACEDATTAIKLAPNLPMAWANRAAARLFLRDLEGALADATQAIHLDGSIAVAYATRSGAHFEKGEADEAIADAAKALELDATLAVAHSNRAGAHMLKNDLAAALADFDRAIALDSRLALAYASRAGLHIRREDLDSAMRDCERAIELDPTLFVGFSNRAGIRDSKGDHLGAIADATHAIELDPRRHEPYIIRGVARQSLKDFSHAIADLETALKLAPANWPHRKEVEKWMEAMREEKNP